MSATYPSARSIAWAVVAGLALVWLIVILMSKYSPADVRAVCATHSGVQQVVDNTWTGGPERATVVCRDGWVGDV
jgi:hypothetical protein